MNFANGAVRWRDPELCRRPLPRPENRSRHPLPSLLSPNHRPRATPPETLVSCSGPFAQRAEFRRALAWPQ